MIQSVGLRSKTILKDLWSSMDAGSIGTGFKNFMMCLVLHRKQKN